MSGNGVLFPSAREILAYPPACSCKVLADSHPFLQDETEDYSVKRKCSREFSIVNIQR